MTSLLLIRNENKEIRIPIEIDTYDTFLKRLRGLMFKRKPLKDKGIILIPCDSIHMFFMFFSIDVVFIDQDYHVLKTVSALKPWMLVLPVQHAYAALELPKDTVKKYSITIGDQLVLDHF